MSVSNHPPVATPRPGVTRNFPRRFALFRRTIAFAAVFLFPFLARFSVHAQILQYGLNSGGILPYCMTVGPDGAYWIAEYGTSTIGRIDSNGIVTVPYFFYTNVGIYSITVGPDSNLWFTESLVDKIGRVSRGTNGSWTNGVLTEFVIHTNVVTNGTPACITAGPDGNLWFTEYGFDLVAAMNTNGQTVHEYGGFSRPTNQLRGIAAGPDGALWFTEETYGTIGRMTTNGVLTEIPLPDASNAYSNSEPLDIIAGPDGAMWFTEFNSNRIGRLTVSNYTYSDYVLPTIGGSSYYNYSQGPYFLTTGSDGNIWFTEFVGGNVSRITPAGFITEFPTINSGSLPTAIACGPDKNIWFCEFAYSAAAEFLLPTLNTSVNSNGQFVLSWPVTATYFILQGNTNLATTNWINLTSPPPAVVSNLFVYTNTISGIQFFRLYETTIP